MFHCAVLNVQPDMFVYVTLFHVLLHGAAQLGILYAGVSGSRLNKEGNPWRDDCFVFISLYYRNCNSPRKLEATSGTTLNGVGHVSNFAATGSTSLPS